MIDEMLGIQQGEGRLQCEPRDMQILNSFQVTYSKAMHRLATQSRLLTSFTLWDNLKSFFL